MPRFSNSRTSSLAFMQSCPFPYLVQPERPNRPEPATKRWRAVERPSRGVAAPVQRAEWRAGCPRPRRRSCPGARSRSCPTTLPKVPPAAVPPRPAAPPSPPSPASASPPVLRFFSGLPSHFRSAASAPALRCSPEPCSWATTAPHTPAHSAHSLPLPPPPLPPDDCFPHTPPPPHAALAGAFPAPPRSLPTRSDALVSSLVSRTVPETPGSRPASSGTHPPSDTSAPLRTSQTASPSLPHCLDIPLPLPLPLSITPLSPSPDNHPRAHPPLGSIRSAGERRRERRATQDSAPIPHTRSNVWQLRLLRRERQSGSLEPSSPSAPANPHPPSLHPAEPPATIPSPCLPTPSAACQTAPAPCSTPSLSSVLSVPPTAARPAVPLLPALPPCPPPSTVRKCRIPINQNPVPIPPALGPPALPRISR